MRVRKLRRKPTGAKSVSGRLVSGAGTGAGKKATATKKRAMGGAKYGAGGVSKLGAKKKRRIFIPPKKDKTYAPPQQPVPHTGGSSTKAKPKPTTRRKRRFGRGG